METTASIPIKFYTVIRSTSYSWWVVQLCVR